MGCFGRQQHVTTGRYTSNLSLALVDILQRLHRNITANQLINYDILRQQQSELIQRQKQEQLWMERMKTMQKTLETSLKESQVG